MSAADALLPGPALESTGQPDMIAGRRELDGWDAIPIDKQEWLLEETRVAIVNIGVTS